MAMPLIETSKDVSEVLALMKPLESKAANQGPVQTIRSAVVDVRSALDVHRLNEVKWVTVFLEIGASAVAALIKVDHEKFAKLLLDKHKRYGALPIRSWGPLGVMIRIDSKLQRYINLTNDPAIDQGDESVVDTMTDILGYAVLGACLAAEKRP